MAVEGTDPVADTTPRASSPGAFVRIVRAIGGSLAVLALVGGLILGIRSLLWIADLEAQPREPPGNIVAIVPMVGAVVGAALALAGGAGLFAVVRHARRHSLQAAGRRT